MASAQLIDQLKNVESTFQELTVRLADPDVATDPAELQRIAKARSSLEATVQAFHDWQKLNRDLQQTEELLRESASDPELEAMARAELEQLRARQEQLEEKLTLLLLPRDPNDEKNIMLEIRAGTGGEEAALWAADLARMYTRYAEKLGWSVRLASLSEGELGGYKEAILEIQGDQVYSKLKFEAGVHRVQRVPVTEAQGRVHTSTATVAVMPEVDEVEVVIDPKDIEIKTARSGGGRRPKREQGGDGGGSSPQAHRDPGVLYRGAFPTAEPPAGHADFAGQTLRDEAAGATGLHQLCSAHAGGNGIPLGKNSHLQLQGQPRYRPPP